jgi:RNA-directed DNA polymerase
MIHCTCKTHAEQLLQLLQSRMESVGLELHPEKTKHVYCRDHRRQEKYPRIKFYFLGYSFQPRTAFSKKNIRLFLGYDCAIRICSIKRIVDKLETQKVNELSYKSRVGVAQYH